MPLHVPIMLVVRAARRGVDVLDEKASVGDPDYLERCKSKHFIPKLPFVIKNGVMTMFGKGPDSELTPEEVEAWRAKSAAAHAEAEAEAEAKKQRKAAEKAEKRAYKDQRKAAKRAEKEQRRAR